MKVVFVGDPTELQAGAGLSRVSTVMFGKFFPMGAEVDVSDLSQDQLRKLLGNPEFKEASVAAGLRAPLIAPASVAPVASEASDADAEEQAEANAHAERAAKRKAKGA